MCIRSDTTSYARAYNFCPNPNFSAKALLAFAQLLLPCPTIINRIIIIIYIIQSNIGHQIGKHCGCRPFFVQIFFIGFVSGYFHQVFTIDFLLKLSQEGGSEEMGDTENIFYPTSTGFNPFYNNGIVIYRYSFPCFKRLKWIQQLFWFYLRAHRLPLDRSSLFAGLHILFA